MDFPQHWTESSKVGPGSSKIKLGKVSLSQDETRLKIDRSQKKDMSRPLVAELQKLVLTQRLPKPTLLYPVANTRLIPDYLWWIWGTVGLKLHVYSKGAFVHLVVSGAEKKLSIPWNGKGYSEE
jgi:hypothetical protein